MRALLRLVLLCMLGPLSVAPARAQCTLAGTASIVGVEIDVPGGARLVVDLEDHEVAVDAGPRGPLVVRSRGALAFSGRAARDAVPVALARAVALGPLALRPGTALERPRFTGAHVRADARLTEGVYAAVGLPCRALRLGPAVEPTALAPDAPTRGALVTVGPRLRVHGTPGGPSFVSIRIEQEPLRLVERARRGGWVRVRRDFFDGSVLDGWVREAELAVAEEAELSEVLMGTLVDAMGGCLRGASHTYHGPATLRAGTLVRLAPGGPVWARARRDVEVRVRWPSGAEDVELEGIEGLRSQSECPNFVEGAWARRRDVTIPELDGAPAP
ncbi:MAG: hypothetical protein KF729_18245 [Sandaracinaceae bacterium]|nr:hypothetical protein [Sandaracinaceae bacterium]